MTQHPALTDHVALRALLDRWVAAGWLRPIDRAVAGFLAHRAPEAAPLAQLAAVLASHQGGSGHVCLDLAAVRENPDFTLRMPPAEPTGGAGREADTPSAVLAGIDLADWRRALADHPAVSTRRWQNDQEDHDGRPLVLVDTDRPQFYLRRYWRVEGRVADGLANRRAVDRPSAHQIRPVLDALYPGSNDTEATDWQKVACALAAHQPFSIITGGPGTGKTTTVVRLLAALTSLHLHRENGACLPRIALCAPTGKAAARLAESIGEKVGEIAAIRAGGFDAAHWPAVAAHLPDEVQTIHRLIGTRPLAEKPRHHRDNPLDLDIVVVDEASMVGMELMGQLVDALPARCRLVMLGDKDQLASVEAGAVLGELCRHAESGDYPEALRDYLQAASGQPVPNHSTGHTIDHPAGEASPGDRDDPVAARIATLRVSHRFGEDSAIGALARAVNRGDLSGALEVLEPADDDQPPGEVDWLLDCPGAAHADRFAARVVDGLRPWLSMIHAQPDGFDPESPEHQATVVELFRRHNAFQLLCALRRGPSGVEGLNARVQDWLAREGLLPATDRIGRSTAWYSGRPVIVTRNDAQLGLANGDMGLTLPTRLENGDVGLRVVFPAPSDAGQPDQPGRPGSHFHWISPARLSEVATAFALTVHKSQGSEFTRVAMVMPERSNPILTRELLYTAITRAKQRFTLVSPVRSGDAPQQQATAVLQSAVSSVTRRSGNLRRRLMSRLIDANSDEIEWRKND